jgi:gas vesicle protein
LSEFYTVFHPSKEIVVMTDNYQSVIQPETNLASSGTNVGTNQSYAPAAERSVDYKAGREEKEPAIYDRQTEAKSTEKMMNPSLSRALIGGLVGATLGTLAGALAGRKTSEGVNHAVKGVGNAFRTIGEGLGQTAKGVGDAAKSVGEGLTYAVVGGSSDAVKGIAEGAKQTGIATANVVQATAEGVNETVQRAAHSIEVSSESAKQSIVDAAEESKEIASNKELSTNQNFESVESGYVSTIDPVFDPSTTSSGAFDPSTTSTSTGI